MSDLCRRYRDELLIRDDGGDGRTVFGLAVPFGVPSRIADWQGNYSETFARGSFAKTIREQGSRVKVLAHHDTRFLLAGQPILRETDAGLEIEASIARTRDGDDVLELIRVGALDSFSVGFSPVKGGDDWNDDMTEVTRRQVRLHEVSLVPFPAYDDALVAGTRTTTVTPLSRDGADEVAAEDTAAGMSVNRNRLLIAHQAWAHRHRKVLS